MQASFLSVPGKADESMKERAGSQKAELNPNVSETSVIMDSQPKEDESTGGQQMTQEFDEKKTNGNDESSARSPTGNDSQEKTPNKDNATSKEKKKAPFTGTRLTEVRTLLEFLEGAPPFFVQIP